MPAVGDFARFDANARAVVVLGDVYADQGHHEHITTEHLVLGLASSQVVDQLYGFPTTFEAITHELDRRGFDDGTSMHHDRRPLSLEVRSIFAMTFDLADAEGRREIGCEHLLIAVLRRADSLGAQVLVDLGVDPTLEPVAWRRPDPIEPGTRAEGR